MINLLIAGLMLSCRSTREEVLESAGTHGRGAGESKEVFTGEVKYEEVSVNYALELETKRQT